MGEGGYCISSKVKPREINTERGPAGMGINTKTFRVKKFNGQQKTVSLNLYGNTIRIKTGMD